MSNISQSQLLLLRPGDRLKYRGIQWNVKDYSTYDDAHGYQTSEWLLRSLLGTECYLLREVDVNIPAVQKQENNNFQNSEIVNWYLADEIHPQLFLPNGENIVLMWQDMQEQKEPYSELQLFSKIYYFESKTKGRFRGDGVEASRITWDYWDKDHHLNLALEAWPNRELHVYSTKIVEPEEFYDLEKGVVKPKLSQGPFSGISYEKILAFLILVLGILLIIFG